jgi:predicted transcriptional regulator
MAEGLDPAVFTVGDVMSTDLVTVRDDEPLAVAMQRMGERCVRRLVVLDTADRLVGVLALEDLLAALAQGLAALTGAVQGAREREIAQRR